MGIRLHHVLQPAPLVAGIDASMDFLHALFGMYPSERVRITNAGVDNAVYALKNETFIELIAPYDPSSAASRLLSGRGPGWHMCSFDLEPGSQALVKASMNEAGVRVVQHNRQATVEAWHLHPRDTGGILVLLAARSSLEDNALYAGGAYKEYISTNTRVIDRILGVSWISDDVDKLAACLSTIFGFEFGPASDDGDSKIRQAELPRGTFVQARAPLGPDTDAAAWLDRCGAGFYHLALSVADSSELDRRAATLAAGTVSRGGARWLPPTEHLAVPIELRT